MKKGRSSKLIELRDKKLLERYIYWYEVNKVRHDETLRILSEEEFFLSPSRIWAIISEMGKDARDAAKLAMEAPPIKSHRGRPKNGRVTVEYSYSLFN